eukprot:TRINITY_DN16478_c0_g1_i4.p1 TRINITY_DN16478_c0_g1~~TRINITY_DN16478_c0_g1_i4.p1  ORF type:complete len:343 (+),score=46.34 TRINITY_DN16478_c0_g1_i4:30-1031(+)
MGLDLFVLNAQTATQYYACKPSLSVLHAMFFCYHRHFVLVSQNLLHPQYGALHFRDPTSACSDPQTKNYPPPKSVTLELLRRWSTFQLSGAVLQQQVENLTYDELKHWVTQMRKELQPLVQYWYGCLERGMAGSPVQQAMYLCKVHSRNAEQFQTAQRVYNQIVGKAQGHSAQAEEKAGEGKVGEGKAGDGNAGDGNAGDGKAGEADGDEHDASSVGRRQSQQEWVVLRQLMEMGLSNREHLVFLLKYYGTEQLNRIAAEYIDAIAPCHTTLTRQKSVEVRVFIEQAMLLQSAAGSSDPLVMHALTNPAAPVLNPNDPTGKDRLSHHVGCTLQ